MIKILYLGSSNDAKSAVDRRRFMHFSALIPEAKVYLNEEAGVKFDILVCSLGGDVAKAKRLSSSIPKFVFDYTNHYLVEKSWFKNAFRNIAGSIFSNKEYCFQSYKNTILELMTRADLIICPSITQKNFLKELGYDSYQLTDFFESEVNSAKLRFSGDGSLFWEGQGVNIPQLTRIASPQFKENNYLMRVVSDEKFGVLGGRVLTKSSKAFCEGVFPSLDFLPWSMDNVNESAKKASLGIIPLDLSDDFIVAKPENKLIYMWLLGLPVLCSPTESYCELEEKVGVKFTWRGIDDWEKSIDKWLCNEGYRAGMARYFHNFAVTNYSDQVLMTRWLNAFKSENIL